MEAEYSKSAGGCAYTFAKFEKQLIAKALKPHLKDFDKRILSIENNPKNERQATFACRIDELRNEKKCIEDIIKDFSK